VTEGGGSGAGAGVLVPVTEEGGGSGAEVAVGAEVQDAKVAVVPGSPRSDDSCSLTTTWREKYDGTIAEDLLHSSEEGLRLLEVPLLRNRLSQRK